MGILHRLVVATACPGTHHRLAMDALLLLRCPDADGWRDLFLNYYEPYLRGAKEPDTKFRDFQNHVLHVRENGWGGAIRTSQLWYERLVIALRRQYWSEAVHTAGILGHYIADPMMPLHTAQSEEEGRVHRAIEWSVANSYDELRNILVTDQGGFPSLPLHDSPDWLARLLRQGAELANAHYETLLDHYNLERGVADPPLGLDQECKDRLAQMIGFAAAAIARVLEKAFVEAGSCPPMCELVVETVLATVKAPMRWVARRYDEEEEQDLLEDILDEVRRTGKAVESLPEDEKLVRKLHAQQVLRVPLRELDALPAKPTGARHGQGAVERDRETGWLAGVLQWEIPVIGWLFADDRPTMAPVGMNALATRMGSPRGSAATGYSAGAVRPAGTRRPANTSRFATARRASTATREAAPEAKREAVPEAGGEAAPGRRTDGGRDGGSRTGRFSRFGRLSRLGRFGRDPSHPANSSELATDSSHDPGREPSTAPGDEPSNRNTRESTSRPIREPAAKANSRPKHETGSPETSHETTQETNNEINNEINSETTSELGAASRFAIRERMSRAWQGVATRVWQGAAQTANKVKSVVPKLRRRKAAAEPQADDGGGAEERTPTTRPAATSATSTSATATSATATSATATSAAATSAAATSAAATSAKPKSSDSTSTKPPTSPPPTSEQTRRDGAGESLIREPKPPASAPASGKSAARSAELRFHLETDSEIVDAPSIGQKLARRLEALNVKTVGELLRADPAKLAARMGGKQFTAETVERWQQQAELMCRVPELRGHDAQILVASGVTNPDDLASVDPATLFELIEPFLSTRDAEEILRGSSPPDLNEVADWIDWAQHARPLPK